jgi:hypothetical protein
MAVDKALNQAPMGMDALEGLPMLGGDEPMLEIEIEISDEDREVAEDMDDAFDEAEDEEFNANLAEDMDDDVLESLAGDLLGEFDDDVSSRKDWMQTYVDGLELLGLKIEDRTEPWPGACGVYHPLLSEALVKFQAETMMETFPAAGPVKTQVIGKETPEKKDAAERVQVDMNYQLTERMVSTARSMSACCGALGWLVTPSRRSTTTPTCSGRWRSLFLQKTWWCPTERPTCRPASA